MSSLADHFATAVEHHQSGRLQAAEQHYRQVLALDPRHAPAWNLLGVVQAQLSQWPAAVDCFRRAIAIDATDAHAHCSLADALKQLGDLAQAIASYRRALALNDALPQAHYNLGVALEESGRRDEAIACYRRAIQLQPGNAQLLYNLGNTFYQQGCLSEAIAEYRRSIDLQPDFAEAYYNLAIALNQQGRWDESQACYRRSIALQPEFAEAYNNLANTLVELGQSDEAIAHYRRAIELRPTLSNAHHSLGNALLERGARDEAIVCYRRALALRPDYPLAAAALAHQLQQVCQWGELPALVQSVVEAVDAADARGTMSGVSPFTFLALPVSTTAEQQLRCARQWAARQLRPAAAPMHASRSKSANSKLRVGYLSADYHYHATAMLVVELFETHDRRRFEIIGYSYGRPDDSPLRRRLVRGLDQFVDLRSLPPAESARRIAQDSVDILVDLKGYTVGARTQILAEHPAPIQVNYLGYPGTMGASFIDYILVDDFIAPSDQQRYYAEKLVHLPGCYQVNDSQRQIAPRTPSRAECGLPEQAFVFCSFNNTYKITLEMFDVWMRLLHAVPGSVLWLLESNSPAVTNLRREAEARGVPSARLVFAPRLPLEEHLARHRLADLFLDTFPVNAHTTASEALWAGCPMVTLAGQTLASRVAGSLLRALGLPELIATSINEYEQIALRLANEPARLAELRARLANRRVNAAVFDAAKFAPALERAYETMWSIYSSGQEPRSFAVTSD